MGFDRGWDQGSLRERVVELEQRVAQLEQEARLHQQQMELSASRETVLHTTLRAAPFGIGLATNRVMGWTNDAFRMMLGYRDEELQGQCTRMLYPSQREFDRVGDIIQSDMRKQGRAAFETQMRCKDGRVLEILLSIAATDPSDLTKGQVFCIVDLTTSRSAERALQHFFQCSSDLLAIVGRDGLAVVLNPAWSKTLGWSEQELKSHPLLDWVHPDDRAGAFVLREHLRDGAPHVTLETRWRHKEGGYRWVSWTAIATSDGTQFIAVGRDVTDDLKASTTLKASEQRFRSIVDNSPWGMHFYKLQSEGLVFQGANRAAERMLGVSHDPFVGKTIEQAFPALVPTDIPGRYKSIAEGGDVWRWEQVDYDEGRIRGAFEVHAFQVSANEMCAAFMEISERKRADAAIREAHAQLERRVGERTAELQALNRELEAFAYSVSHDLRGPLRAMYGFGDALLEDCGPSLDDRGRHYVARIREGAQTMASLIEGLLVLSRVSRREMVREPVDLSMIASSVCSRLCQLDPQRHVQVDIEPGLLTKGDPRLLQLVLDNLLGNAWKFTRTTSSPTIRFGAESQEQGRVFFVRDNGVGFDMRYVDKLFRAFGRLHTSQEFEGSGIGLATVQRIVHRHQGRVWAEGSVGSGTIIRFTLGQA